MGFFKKDRKVFGMSFFVRMLIMVLVVLIVGTSGTVLLAEWQYNADDDPWTDGYVGIGENEPISNIHVKDREGGIILEGERTSEALPSRWKIITELCSGNSDQIMGLNFRELISDKHSNLFLKANGFTGIGTTDPDAFLHINTITGKKGIRVDVPSGSTAPALQIRYDGSPSIQLKGSGDSYFNNGNIGIGTSTPLSPLHVFTDAVSNKTILLQGSGDSTTQYYGGSISFYHRNYSSVRHFYLGNVWPEAGASSFRIGGWSTNTGYKDFFTIIEKNGYVGIGTTIPAAKLHVAGKSIFDDTVTAASYACTSDARYKKNISPCQNGLEKVLGLRGVTYFWNAEKDKDRNFSKDKQIGFIAQEVEKVIPEVVYTDDKGFKTMSYDRLTAVLVEAVKELKAEKDGEIAFLKEKDIQKEKEIAALKSENEALKQRLVKFESLADRLAVVERELDKNKGRNLAKR